MYHESFFFGYNRKVNAHLVTIVPLELRIDIRILVQLASIVMHLQPYQVWTVPSVSPDFTVTARDFRFRNPVQLLVAMY